MPRPASTRSMCWQMVGSEDAAKEYTTEQALLSKQIESQEPMGTEMMLGFVAKDMETSINLYNSGNNEVIDITGDASFAAKVVPPYSKITFKITKDLPSDQTCLFGHNRSQCPSFAC